MNYTHTIKKPLLVYGISILMLVATAARGLILAFESNSDYRWLIAGLLVLYGILLFSEVAIMQRFPFYLKAYFLIQAIIVAVILVLPYQIETPGISETTDFYALLFIPLCVQAIFYFPRPASYYWIAVLTATSVTALFYQYGLSDGIKFSVTYILAYAMVGLLAIFYADAEEAKNDLNQANQKLQDYAGKVEALAVAEERNRLARDLHDSVTQSLYSLTLFAEAASEELSAGELDTVSEHLKELRHTSQQALQEMRLMVFELRPPELEKKGLALALKERLEAVESRAGIETALNFDFDGRLPSNVERSLYSIAREAMNNILKHAQATEIIIDLKKEGAKVIFEIRDNGVGLDHTLDNFSSGLGVKGMQERADRISASLRLEANPEGGTRLKVEVEVPDDRND